MKVSELIEKLSECDPNAEVIMRSDNFELHGSLVPVKYVNAFKAQRKLETFRDAFDGETYSTEVFNVIDGNLTVVKLS